MQFLSVNVLPRKALVFDFVHFYDGIYFDMPMEAGFVFISQVLKGRKDQSSLH